MLAHLEDIEYLRREFGARNRSFTPQSREEFYRRLGALESAAEKLTACQFIMGVAHAVAAINDGHTDVLAIGHMRRFPIRFSWFADGLFVLKATPAHKNLLSARVTSIAGTEPEKIRQALSDYIPGVRDRVNVWSAAYLSSPDVLQAIGVCDTADTALLSFQLPDGSLEKQELPGQAWGFPDIQPREWRTMVPGSDPDGTKGRWLSVLDGSSSVPLYLQEPEKLYTHQWLDDGGILYVRVSTTKNHGELRLDDYLKGILEQAAARRPQHIIVDLRFNDGGMFSLIRDFSYGVRKVVKEDGKIFVITGNHTFSAGICMTAFLKYFSEGKVLIVGEPVGDNEQFWAEGDFLTLPNSGLSVAYTDGYFDLEAKCEDFHTNYWMNVVYGVPAGKLTPDLPVKISFSDYIRGHDPCIAAIADHLGMRAPGHHVSQE